MNGSFPCGRRARYALSERHILTTFETLGLTGAVLYGLKQLDFTTPTPIQSQGIPAMLAGRDIMGLAQTGTGKTGAFGLPIIQQLLREPLLAQDGEVRALILAPTRELASQIVDNLRLFAKRSPLKIQLVVGGQSARTQAMKLAKGCDICVATPGRLLDHAKSKSIKLGGVKHLVLDEADQMLDLGFIKDLRRIAKLVPQERQTAMFSATMPDEINALAKDFLTNPQRIEVTPPGKTVDKIEQSLLMVEKADKPARLRAVLSTLKKPHVIVFARTKHGADRLSRDLTKYGYANAAIHGNKSQGQRTRALQAFKNGEIRILVATDVAARGIDIPGITHVFNYDLPEVPDVYVHRIGRTARAGADGAAIAFCSNEERKLLRAIENLMKARVDVVNERHGDPNAQASDWFADNRPAEAAPAAKPAKSGKPSESRGRGDNRRSARGDGKPQRSPSPKPRPAAPASADSDLQASGGNDHKSGPRRTKPRKAFRGRKPSRAAA